MQMTLCVARYMTEFPTLKRTFSFIATQSNIQLWSRW